jgi:hypothetical protein
MTTSDRNDLIPAQQEKLEWVTPRLTLMEAASTEKAKLNLVRETTPVPATAYGPS